MRFMILLSAVVVASACVAACTREVARSSARPTDAPYQIAGEADGAPVGCGVDAVANRVVELFSGINDAEPGTADRFFGDGVDAPFEWFSFTDAVPGGLGHFAAMNPDNPAHFDSAYARSDLDAYFAQRRALGDTFVLRGINFIGWEPSTGDVSLSPILFEYHRPDPTTGVESVHLGSGKAGYHCASATFRVMSLSSTEEARWQRMYQIHLASAEGT